VDRCSSIQGTLRITTYRVFGPRYAIASFPKTHSESVAQLPALAAFVREGRSHRKCWGAVMRRVSWEVIGQLVAGVVCFALAASAYRGWFLNVQFAPRAVACGLIALGGGVYIASHEPT
jgi:hypothetical protein